ncbi:BRO-N domain-containing protein [Desulfotignum phosphitoxidans]|uniref:Prophage antirepressor protein n=1 Tax=Desulfotignum phosphitoxidans DSM 13687 TaxID=1286635 RepID=S0FWW6_9BACT|nr:BRO family protein [Desulfotignum phosphitoxidans]EMS79190.1 prophage antirepressor protein [Desulfotignum phosphitoxidans DSM 13687]
MDNNAVMPFSFGDQLVRVVKDEEGTPWWVARDVCKVLRHKDVNMAVKNLDDDEKLIQTLFVSGQNRQVITINESGLYTLIIRSNKPEAKTFRRWITHEVLPSIRKTGAYAMPGMEQEGYMAGTGARKSGHLYFPMAKLVESADKYLEGRAALKALHYFTGMPVDDLLEELESKQRTAKAGTLDGARDLVEDFLADCCDLSDAHRVPASDLYQAFADWTRENGVMKVITKKRFGLILGNSFDRIKSGNIFYMGLRLKEHEVAGFEAG